MFQVHERCFSPSLSEFKHTKMRNGAMAQLNTAYGPPVGNHWFRLSMLLASVVQPSTHLLCVRVTLKAADE